MVMRRSVSNLFILFLLCFSVSLPTANAINGDKGVGDAPRSIFDRLSEQEILEISVKTDIEKLLANKHSSKYQGAYLKLSDAADTDAGWFVQIRTRGKFRKRVCDFPPLKLKFDHSVLGPENLKGYKSLKLVTHCGDRAGAEELLQKEYLAYKIYNTITDRSLRVQLVKINYIDSKEVHQIGEKWGFIIENKKELAERIGGGVYEEYGVSQDELNSKNAAQNSLFQYMIGNADWSLEQKKNICLIKSNTSSEIVIIPYDFDFSGLVDAPYAVPISEYGLKSIKERIYLGESTSQEISEAMDFFKSKKKDILDQINSFSHLSRSERNKLKKYIESFYSSLNEPMKSRTL